MQVLAVPRSIARSEEKWARKVANTRGVRASLVPQGFWIARAETLNEVVIPLTESAVGGYESAVRGYEIAVGSQKSGTRHSARYSALGSVLGTRHSVLGCRGWVSVRTCSAVPGANRLDGSGCPCGFHDLRWPTKRLQDIRTVLGARHSVLGCRERVSVRVSRRRRG
jgi:hypothetical protein